MYESSVYRCNPVCKNVSILDSFFPPPLAYSYWVVFSLNIQIDQQSKLNSFAKTKLVHHWCLCLFVQANLVEFEKV